MVLEQPIFVIACDKREAFAQGSNATKQSSPPSRNAFLDCFAALAMTAWGLDCLPPVRISNSQFSRHCLRQTKKRLRKGATATKQSSAQPGFVVSVSGIDAEASMPEISASGYQAHTTSPSAEAGAFVRRAASVHRIPRSTFVTIAIRPS